MGFVFQSISTAMGVMGALQEGKALAAQYEADAAADDFNAAIADQLAINETQKAGGDAIDFRRAQTAKQSTAFANRAGSGLRVGEGSLALVDEKIFQEIEFGVQRIVAEGQIGSHRARQQGQLLRAGARAKRISADNVVDASRLSALGAGAKGMFGLYTTLSGGTQDGWGMSRAASSSTGPLDIRPTSPTFGMRLRG